MTSFSKSSRTRWNSCVNTKLVIANYTSSIHSLCSQPISQSFFLTSSLISDTFPEKYLNQYSLFFVTPNSVIWTAHLNLLHFIIVTILHSQYKHDVYCYKYACLCMCVCMYIIRGGPEIRPLHRDLQWTIVLPILINPLLILHFEWNVGLYLWGHHNSHFVP
jgi:hypothetical protein